MKYQTIFECSILVKPTPKGRPRFTKRGFAYTPKETKDFETLLKNTISNFFSSSMIVERPLRMEAVFYIERPKSVKRDYPTSRPDLDNYLKALMDACNEIVYKDDALICDLNCSKRYSFGAPYIFLKLSYLDAVVDHEIMPS
jgi:Holliday junction resolvase RusA-like endonuclease